MKIKIGLFKKDFSWQTVLEQIGCDWDYFDFKNINSENYSLLIINDKLNGDEVSAVKYYLENGGAVINNLSEDYFDSNISFSSQLVRNIFPNEYKTIDVLDFPTKINFANNSLFHFANQKGLICYFPLNLSEIFLNTSTKRKSFYFKKERLSSEIVNETSKGAITFLIKSIIEQLHHKRNLPFAHKWFYPLNSKSIFTFRIDSDKSDKSTILSLYNLLNKNKISANWFLDVSSHQNWFSIFKDFQNQSFGYHCYKHKIANNYNDLLKDFENAKKYFSQNDFEINSASAIYGKWNLDFAKLYEEKNIKYSSEFSFTYDTLPFFPFTENKIFSTLQIPIHPICIGTLRQSGYSQNEMTEYFINHIDKCLKLNLPIMLYHHPLDKNHEVLQNIFDYIKEKAIPNISYDDYFNFWMARMNSKIEFDFNQQNNILKIKSDSDSFFSVSSDENNFHLVNDKDEFNFSNFNFTKKDIYSFPEDYNRIRDFDLRHLIQSFLFYIQTR